MGSQFLDQRSNRWPLHWKCRVLTSGLPGKSLCCSVAQSCLILCDHMDCNTSDFPVLQHLPVLAPTHVHWIGDAIQLSHPLLSLSPPTFNLSHHQGLFKWVGSLHQGAKVLELQLQHQSFQWIFGTDSFRIYWFDLFAAQGTLKSLFQHHVSKTSVLQCPMFLLSSSHIHTWLLEKTIALTRRTFIGKVMFLLLNMLGLS